MSSSPHDPPQQLPAHAVAAGVAGLALLAAQTGWPAVLAVANSRQQLVAGLTLVATTAFLAATCWLHAALLRRQAPDPRDRQRLVYNIPTDAALALVMIAVFFKAPNLNVWQSGLWLLPPLILTTSGVSALALGIAIWRRRASPPAASTAPLPFYTPPRSWVGLALLVAMLLLG
ncbi:MAG: hypothetical protein SFU86_21120 [Pirellulaceae bacterium]|nr:hypothetical protein [Pirellulaceae bacterium]